MTKQKHAASGQADDVSGSESQNQQDTGKMVHTSSRGNLKRNPAQARKVLNLIAAGESVRAACKAHGVSRRAFLKLCESNPEWRERLQTSLAARAHALADDIVMISDGADTADVVAAAVAKAVAVSAPGHAESVARAVIREQVARDRLRVDSRKWIASRLLKAIYGAQTDAQQTPQGTHVRITFDPLPAHLMAKKDAAPAPADFEILETDSQ